MQKNILILLALLLTGCETFETQRLCEEVSWFNEGKKSGSIGLTKLSGSSRDLAKRCMNVDRNPNIPEIEKGIQSGLTIYCTTEQAQKTALRGKTFNLSLCPSADSQKLNAAFESGRQLFCKNEGYNAGLNEITAEFSCPENLSTNFEVQYQKGKLNGLAQSVHSLKSKVESMQNQIEDLEHDNRRLKSSNSELESKNRELESKISTLGH